MFITSFLDAAFLHNGDPTNNIIITTPHTQHSQTVGKMTEYRRDHLLLLLGDLSTSQLCAKEPLVTQE